MEDGSYYFRLTTRSLDQQPFQAARDRLGDAVLRRQVLAGAYRLVDAGPPADGAPMVHLAGSGAVLPEVLAAAAELGEEGIAANVVDITSADRLYRAWQRTLRQGVRTATVPSIPGALRSAFGDRAFGGQAFGDGGSGHRESGHRGVGRPGVGRLPGGPATGGPATGGPATGRRSSPCTMRPRTR